MKINDDIKCQTMRRKKVGEGGIGLFDSAIGGTGLTVSRGDIPGRVKNSYICRTSRTIVIKFIIIFFLITSIMFRRWSQHGRKFNN
ncbi:unnamed protein product [Rotaria sordida]|uniref:Uncharacterized protein n=1 Tax=Rotaria sordida TaxID=392033 RepID=A0A814LTQ2_9BILA|nr:unnamed protein product [Rotaria sordida]